MSLSVDEIIEVVNKMENEAKAIKHELFKICWYMRGGLTSSESYLLDRADREAIASIIKENLETTKESGMPFF